MLYFRVTRQIALFLIFVILLVILILSVGKTSNDWVSQGKVCNSNLDQDVRDKCYRDILTKIVDKEGPESALEVLDKLIATKIIGPEFDDHLLIHEVGRALARLRGTNIDAFLACPTSHNYGCQHGFFEYSLSQTNSYKEAAENICEKTVGLAQKLYAYCYHGVGHGVMMAKAYNVDKSLEVCNELPTQFARESCWQGVLMENSNQAVTNPENVVGFSNKDPLAPCNRLADKYKWQCYINHGGYLMKVTNGNLVQAAKICYLLKEAASPCIRSLGLMVVHPLWQRAILNIDTTDDIEKNAKSAWQLCMSLPSLAHLDCVIGGVSNIINFDNTDTRRANFFCSLVDSQFRTPCLEEIDRQISGLVSKTVNEEKLIKDDKYLTQKIKEWGLGSVVEKLSTLMGDRGLSCHDRAHETGRLAYEILADRAFKECSSLCHSGCYHGAAEAFFRDRGTADLEKNLNLICTDEKNRFFSHQCVHGVGHGLLAWSNYELFEALDVCDSLKTREAQSSCYTGVFMENIVGGLATDTHYSRYLNNDPHFPCNNVPEKYRGECYFLQTSRMVQLFQGDFQKIAQECLRAGRYQRDCFQSMGRDVGGNSKPDVKLAISKCQFAPSGQSRTDCLTGAAQDFFWDPGGANLAFSFCRSLNDNEEANRCWETINTRASEILKPSDYQDFCQKIPKGYITCQQNQGYIDIILEEIKRLPLSE